MHIAINLRLYMKGEIGGLENYVRNVVRGIAASQQDAQQPLTIFVRRTEIENVRELAPQARILTVLHIISDACTAAELAVGGYDVLFCPLLILEPESATVPSAVMVPDLLHEFHPEFFPAEILEWRHRHYRPTIERADVVFTLSEDAKATIVDRFDVAAEKVVVVHLDVDPEFRAAPTETGRRDFERLALPQEYLYFPANYWPHKNHEALLRAMGELTVEYPSLHLVLSGATATGEGRVRDLVSSLGLESRVRILGYQDRALLPEIYRHARMLVFPSLFEGFGIPILEAFHSGVPAVISNSGSCPEIAGDAAVLVDASDPAAIAAAVARVLADPELRRELVARGRARESAFSWSDAVAATLQSLERIVSHRPARQIVVEDRPVVSIVTPTFNMAKYLEETIQSVLSQDYPHIDYIVMDGGSTDGTLEILRKYEGRLRYRSEPDRGQADAVNKGFLESRGRVFAFLNADDTYLEGAVGKALHHLVTQPGVGVVYGEGYHVFENGERIGRYPTRPFEAESFARNCYICQPTAFMWSDIFESVGMMNTNVIALDYDLWIRIHQQGHRFLKVDDELATSRMYRDNKTMRARGAVYRDIIDVVKRRHGYVPYDWLFGYGCYLVDGKDQFFEPTSSSRFKILVSLALGVFYNPLQLRRYLREWAGNVGLVPNFSGRWEDGWISKHFAQEHVVDDTCRKIRISGRNLAPLPRLELTIRLGGVTLGTDCLTANGPFLIEYPCPDNLRGAVQLLEIDCSNTFRPRSNEDHRHLSCLVDSIELVGGEE